MLNIKVDVIGDFVLISECDRLRPGIQPKLNALRSLYEGKKIIVARDKLDVVKGVVQKVLMT